MADEPRGPSSGSHALPDNPSIDWLKKQAKRRLEEMRVENRDAKLADAQFDLAKTYGFASWRALKAHIDSLTVEGQLVEAARDGNVEVLTRLLDQHPDKLFLRIKPYDFTLLHAAARHFSAVDLLLKRGLDVNARERGDNTYAMHWAAAAGALDIVTRLADAGGDVIGLGDDHELEVIGWASCWDGCDDDAHRAVVEFLIGRGARHHIFSAISMSLADEVRRIVKEDPSALSRRMSRNENNRTPLQHAIRMNRQDMVRLLVELGADPLAVDSFGMSVAGYSETSTLDRPVMERIRTMTLGELDSARRGLRPARAEALDLAAVLALGDFETAEAILGQNPRLVEPSLGVLHLMTKRGDRAAVKWLLDRGANPSGIWAHFDADVTPLHLAAFANHPDVAQVLLDAGANPAIRDTQHDSDAMGWAEFFQREEIAQMIAARRKSSSS